MFTFCLKGTLSYFSGEHLELNEKNSANSAEVNNSPWKLNQQIFKFKKIYFLLSQDFSDAKNNLAISRYESLKKPKMKD